MICNGIEIGIEVFDKNEKWTYVCTTTISILNLDVMLISALTRTERNTFYSVIRIWNWYSNRIHQNQHWLKNHSSILWIFFFQWRKRKDYFHLSIENERFVFNTSYRWNIVWNLSIRPFFSPINCNTTCWTFWIDTFGKDHITFDTTTIQFGISTNRFLKMNFGFWHFFSNLYLYWKLRERISKRNLTGIPSISKAKAKQIRRTMKRFILQLIYFDSPKLLSKIFFFYTLLIRYDQTFLIFSIFNFLQRFLSD